MYIVRHFIMVMNILTLMIQVQKNLQKMFFKVLMDIQNLISSVHIPNLKGILIFTIQELTMKGLRDLLGLPLHTTPMQRYSGKSKENFPIYMEIMDHSKIQMLILLFMKQDMQQVLIIPMMIHMEIGITPMIMLCLTILFMIKILLILNHHHGHRQIQLHCK